MQEQGHSQKTREDLLTRSRERHDQFVALIDQIPAEDQTRPGVNDDWSVKDHMAHLTWWEQRVLTILRGEPDPIGALPKPRDTGQVAAVAHVEENLARVNAHVRTLSLALPLAEVRAAFDESYQQMLRLIESAPDDLLIEHYDSIEGDSASHYEEHIGWIANWMARERPTSR